MIAYRVTVSIALSHQQEWVQWMRAAHIPDVLATGYFRRALMQRQRDPVAPEGMATYNITYWCDSMEELEQYQSRAAPALQAEHTEKYSGHFTASRVISEELEAFYPDI